MAVRLSASQLPSWPALLAVAGDVTFRHLTAIRPAGPTIVECRSDAKAEEAVGLARAALDLVCSQPSRGEFVCLCNDTIEKEGATETFGQTSLLVGGAGGWPTALAQAAGFFRRQRVRVERRAQSRF